MERGGVEDFNVLLAGTISKGKGQREAMLAIEELIRRDCKNCRLYLAGGVGEEKELSYLKAFVKQRRLEKYISILGHIDHIEELRKNMDITLMCSSAEAFGRVTVESMKAGIPVIGADTGGTVELIDHGKNGYLYHKGNYMELADYIERLYRNPNRLREMRKMTLKMIKGKFTQKENAEAIERLYYEVIKREK